MSKIWPRCVLDRLPFYLFQVQAQALYDFQGNAPGEITMKSGDIIYLRWKVDDHWYYGESKESSGLVPVNVVRVLSEQPLALCRALYDFNANNLDPDDSKECLTFFKVNLFFSNQCTTTIQWPWKAFGHLIHAKKKKMNFITLTKVASAEMIDFYLWQNTYFGHCMLNISILSITCPICVIYRVRTGKQIHFFSWALLCSSIVSHTTGLELYNSSDSGTASIKGLFLECLFLLLWEQMVQMGLEPS